MDFVHTVDFGYGTDATERDIIGLFTRLICLLGWLYAIITVMYE